MLYRFHVRLTAADPRQGLATFDDALARLARLPQMFAEPDGAFVWASPPEVVPRWQVEGNLADGGERLYYVELKGACPPTAFDELRSCVAAPSTLLALECVAEGVVLDAPAFRARLEQAATRSGA